MQRLFRFPPIRLLLGIRRFLLIEVKLSKAPKITLQQESEAICSVPDYRHCGLRKDGADGMFAPLHLRTVKGAVLTVNHRFASVFEGRNCWIQNRVENGPFLAHKGGIAYQTANIVGQLEDELYVRRFKEQKRAGDVLYVGTRATYNWSHFLINFLPGVFLANEFAKLPLDVPLLVPSTVLSNPTFSETLQIVLQGRAIEPIEEGQFLRFDKVHWIDSPAYDGPFSARTTSRKPLVWHGRAMTEFVTFLNSQIDARRQLHQSRKKRRIYIDRREGSPRPVKVENLPALLDKYGIESVRMEELSIIEKRDLMSGVSDVIAPSGSGLANILFAHPGVNVLTFSYQQAPVFDNFVPNLIELMEGKMRLFSIGQHTEMDNSSSYTVPAELMETQLEKFFLNAPHASS